MRSIARAVFLCLGLSKTALPADDQLQAWPGINLNYGINDTYSANFLVQARISTDGSTEDIYLLRPSLHLRLTPRWVAGLGYDYLPRWHGPDEQRGWQELALTNRFHKLELNNRLRIEERFIKDLKTIVRGRYRLLGTHPISNRDWYGIGSNEVLVNLNSHANGPVGGFEENRLFVGLGVRLTSDIRIETGYLWRYFRLRRRADENNHTLMFTLFFDTR